MTVIRAKRGIQWDRAQIMVYVLDPSSCTPMKLHFDLKNTTMLKCPNS